MCVNVSYQLFSLNESWQSIGHAFRDVIQYWQIDEVTTTTTTPSPTTTTTDYPTSYPTVLPTNVPTEQPYYDDTEWILSPTKMPVATYEIAGIGQHKGNVFIVGGFNWGTGLMQYNTNTGVITGNNVFFQPYFQRSLTGYAQTWTQIDNTLYFSGDSWGYIHKFELDTQNFTAGWTQASTTHYVGFGACLAGSDKYQKLYYAGGYDQFTRTTFNSLKIFDINTETWSAGPNMIEIRRYHACVVSENDKLYAIAGGGTTGRLTTVEYIPISDINNQNWMYTSNELQYQLSYLPLLVLFHSASPGIR